MNFVKSNTIELFNCCFREILFAKEQRLEGLSNFFSPISSIGPLYMRALIPVVPKNTKILKFQGWGEQLAILKYMGSL